MHKLPVALWLIGWPALVVASQFSPHYTSPDAAGGVFIIGIWIGVAAWLNVPTRDPAGVSHWLRGFRPSGNSSESITDHNDKK